MNRFGELLAVLKSGASNSSIYISGKRRPIIIDALRIAEADVAGALLELLQYSGGWDLKDKDHPIVKARRALERAGVKL